MKAARIPLFCLLSMIFIGLFAACQSSTPNVPPSSVGPSAPPSMKGPSQAPPLKSAFDNSDGQADPDAITEKDTRTYTLPIN